MPTSLGLSHKLCHGLEGRRWGEIRENFSRDAVEERADERDVGSKYTESGKKQRDATESENVERAQ